MRILKLIFVVFIMVLVCTKAIAIKKEFKFDKIDFKYRTIESDGATIRGLDQGNLRAMGKAEAWGVIKTIYESSPKWVDNVAVNYYVLLKSKKNKEPIMLAGKIEYTDVAKGKHHVSNMYVPPQILRRYGEVLKIRAEIWYNEILQDEIQWPNKTTNVPWWTRIKARHGSLMNRFYTPFEHEQQLEEELIKID